MFQFTMSCGAARRRFIVGLCLFFAALSGALGFLFLFENGVIVYGLLVGALAFLCVMAAILNWNREFFYTITDRRVILKNKSVNRQIDIDSIKSMKARVTRYQSHRGLTTITLTDRKNKKHYLKDIFNAKEAIEYLNEKIARE